MEVPSFQFIHDFSYSLINYIQTFILLVYSEYVLISPFSLSLVQAKNIFHLDYYNRLGFIPPHSQSMIFTEAKMILFKYTQSHHSSLWLPITLAKVHTMT